jgi:hypothetical protein
VIIDRTEEKAKGIQNERKETLRMLKSVIFRLDYNEQYFFMAIICHFLGDYSPEFNNN